MLKSCRIFLTASTIAGAVPLVITDNLRNVVLNLVSSESTYLTTAAICFSCERSVDLSIPRLMNGEAFRCFSV